MKHVLYVYGTLRSGGPTIRINATMYNLGWFPGIILGGTDEVTVERVEVDDLSNLDRYEGYHENDPEGSLFVRRPFLDGWIYEYNGPVNESKKILSGDFLEFKGQAKGSANDLIERAKKCA